MPSFLELIEEIRDTPFPNDTKVRIFITGLAFCFLRNVDSTVKFLSGIPNHVLAMAVIKRVRRSGALYPTRIILIKPGDAIGLTMADSDAPVNPPAGSKFPISEIRNLVDIHHGKLIRYSGTSDPADASFPSALTITHAAFYTHSMHDNFFQLKENLTGNVTAPDELGYVIGGTILKPAAGLDGDVTLTSTKGSFDVPQPRTMLLKGVEGEEVVYDIIFDNHCKPRDAALCDKEVTNHGGPDGTDFFYYYKVLEEIEHPGREFDLVNFRQPDIFTTGGSGEVAACNPILVDPAP